MPSVSPSGSVYLHAEFDSSLQKPQYNTRAGFRAPNPGPNGLLVMGDSKGGVTYFTDAPIATTRELELQPKKLKEKTQSHKSLVQVSQRKV